MYKTKIFFKQAPPFSCPEKFLTSVSLPRPLPFGEIVETPD